MREQGRNPPLIRSDQAGGKCFHSPLCRFQLFAAARKSCARSAYEAPAAERFTLKTKSLAGDMIDLFRRKTSRRSRLMLLRTTGLPIFRETVTPNRWWG